MIDHALAITFAIGFPVINVPLYARRRALLLAGDHQTRLREYWETVLWLTSMGLATLLVWVATGRNLSALGLAFTGSWRSLLGMAIAIGAATLLLLQALAVRRDGQTLHAARTALEAVREYLPENHKQVRLFRVVSLSAGIGEELFYRGFLLWYLTLVVPLAWAIVLSSILFGLAHIMHGMGATVRATIIGAVLAGLYIFSGALWASMVLHTAIDLSTGETAMAVVGRESEATA